MYIYKKTDQRKENGRKFSSISSSRLKSQEIAALFFSSKKKKKKKSYSTPYNTLSLIKPSRIQVIWLLLGSLQWKPCSFFFTVKREKEKNKKNLRLLFLINFVKRSHIRLFFSLVQKLKKKKNQYGSN
ncbi:hypothetical protein CPARA_1gp172 (nucleomorph) [Cryptomonas paramecium]|uniref:Uncharacterized protein n=1 Tax=Cryptomonas paramaecium TaxID=2898 RepID=F2HHN4_9CRYP|nr:hypothetical protein CPARA_1gp172 [Cryptomonas paramecium]AEA38830.1 hypothetical protein CPARA_1gp172 [Cryptomonas paramecium]